MTIHEDFKRFIENVYCGHILDGDYSKTLKDRVSEIISISLACEKIGSPAIPYLAAWHEDIETIWYEFAGKRFAELVQCEYSKLAEVFRNKVIDHRIYKYQELDTGIKKEIINREELSSIRRKLREKNKKMGIVDAVYKIKSNSSKAVWLKDQAKIEIHSQDKICLSLGNLTVLSKEMEAEEELRAALKKIETLSGLLPICSECKRIRDYNGQWNDIELYIEEHSKAEFTHGICPDCQKELYPEFWAKRRASTT